MLSDSNEFATIVAVKENNAGEFSVDMSGIDNHTVHEIYALVGVLEGIQQRLLNICEEYSEDEDDDEDDEEEDIDEDLMGF